LHTSYEITVRFQDSSRTRAVLKAGKAIAHEDRKQTLLGGGVNVVFHDRKSGLPAAWLDADSAMVDDRTKDMTAFGNVHVRSDSSRTTLDTPQLVWDQKSERIRTSERVRITTPTEVIDGVGLVSDQLLTDYKIFNVRGVHQP
jgi:LPS export ABC transporter protein LptC